MDVIDRQTRYFSMHANCYVISLIVIRTAVCRNSIITFLAVPYSLRRTLCSTSSQAWLMLSHGVSQ